ncbi:MAG: RNA methyltransferase [Bacteroidales bacterium]
MNPSIDLNQQKALIEHLRSCIAPQRYNKFIEVLENRTQHLCVVLENIYQSQNASAILRTCECFGIQDVHIIEKSFDYTISPEVALGSNKWLNLQYAQPATENNTLETYQKLKAAGYQIVATCLHQEAESLYDYDFTKKTALVFGTELSGLSPQAIALADKYIHIPIVGFTESYNVSVSAALCLQHLSRQLRNSSIPWQLDETSKLQTLLQWMKNSIRASEQIVARWEKEQMSKKNIIVYSI